jgi:GT2 family glycosyltransferase
MTEECIDSIINNTLVEHEIVIVDNGSREEERISDTYRKKVTYIRLEENINFAGGCNTGAAKAKYPLLCFMNNDILLKSGWDDIVGFMAENPSAGIVGPKLLYPNGNIQHAGVQVLGTSYNGNVFDHRYRHFPSNHPFVNEQREYQCLTGACFFISKQDFETVGGFDTGYKNGYEDNDLCFKVRFQLNKKVIYYPLSEVIHKESVTSSKVSYAEAPNKTLFFQRWADKLVEDKSKWDRIDSGYRFGADSLAIIFWCSGSELDGQIRPDKHRPTWYDKKKNFKSLMNAAQGIDVYVIYDGQENDYTNYIKSQPIKEFTRINVGSGLESIKEVYRKISSLFDKYDHFYISEDDYMYLPDAFNVLLQGVNRIENSIFTLYDHPDRYTRTDDITYGQEKLTITDSCHWRTAESTCSSFCVSKEILKANADIFTGQLPDRELSRELYRRGVRLWSPIHGRATHLNTLFMTPFIDWGKLNAHIQI